MEPFDETHPLEGVMLLGAGRVLDRLRCEPRSKAIDTARSLLALTMLAMCGYRGDSAYVTCRFQLVRPFQVP
jgi:hypothetical protein